ncbi:CotH kinase family protein [Peribacillus frigoritolerans]|uniref:CotH kinase family protein n=1 Tax=Peribacillus frigoritolerans TaxID=450367 RepID=A0AAJ1QSU9_9BACI|nr:CotH kinase family protein [Peribacillus frigoritolerans]MDM5287281.1 CotH kinase family protein [Peribacillus frigoritolerans]
MIKTRYVAATIGLLIMIFIAVLFFLPNLQVEKATKGNTYTESVFDQSKVTTVDITLADEDLDSILDNPSEKEIVNADVTIDGETVKNVGFRTKGNLSLNSVVQMGDSDRYSWKIDFDYYQEDQDLHGLKKLALNNNYSDPTYMREYLSYELMDKMGIATPGHSYMYVTINGKEWGLYLGVEAIEETFLNTNFTDGTGDLYYPDGTGSDLKWISEDIGDYTGLNLKTNDNSDQSAMIKLLDSINNGGNLEEVLDVDEMLRYFAANTALVNLDHYQGDKKHNYYLYEENGVFSILPWDYNMSFGGYSGGGGRRAGASDQETADQNDGTAAEGNDDDTKQDDKELLGGAPNMNGGGMMDMSSNFMNESNINFSITEPVSGTALEERPLLNALLSNDEYREKYYDYLNDIATDFFAEENMTAMTTEISTLITPYVKKDPTKFYTMDEYTEATSGEETLVDFAVQRAESILAQLSGDLVVEAETESSMGGGAPTIGADANPGQQQQPNMGGENGPAMQPPDMDRGGNGAPPGIDGNMGQKGADNSSSSKDTIILSSVLLLLLIGAMAFAHFFKRRGKKG